MGIWNLNQCIQIFLLFHKNAPNSFYKFYISDNIAQIISYVITHPLSENGFDSENQSLQRFVFDPIFIIIKK